MSSPDLGWDNRKPTYSAMEASCMEFLYTDHDLNSPEDLATQPWSIAGFAIVCQLSQ